MHKRFLDQVKQFLRERGVEGYLVGGYVRDVLLGRSTNDIDIAIAGDALVLGRQLADAITGHFVLLDQANNIARVVSDDGQDYVDLNALRNNDLHTDLAARDFTFNALAIPLSAERTTKVIDLFGGQNDLRARRVRAVTDSTFQDDPARLVRAVRFAAQFGYSIEPHTAALAQRDALLLKLTAAERVRDEFAKILAAPGAWRNLRLLDDLHLLSPILPELDTLRGVEQRSQHYYDVFTHTLAVTDAIEDVLVACQLADVGKRPDGPPHPPLPVGLLGDVAERVRTHLAETVSADRTRVVTLKLGALFHDIAKPQTQTTDADGETRFFDHPAQGVPIAEEAMRRLRFSLREIRIVNTMVMNHMRPAQIAADPQSTKKAIYRYFRDTGVEGVDTLILSLADHVGTGGPRLDVSYWWQHAQFTRLLLEYYYSQPEPAAPLPKLITGDDIMRLLHLPAGPQVGQILEDVREAQVMGDVRTREQALEYVQKKMAE